MIYRERCQSKISKSHKSSESGFTIIESLVAIIVVTLLMIAISPVIVLAVANRVQARRVEMASQAARSYIDGVRAESIEPPSNIIKDSTGSTLNSKLPPTTGNLNCSANAYCPGARELYCIDNDGDGACRNTSTTDLIVQAFGAIPVDGTGTSVYSTQGYQGYRLGVRVYRAYVFSQAGTFPQPNGQKQASFGGGLGLSKLPLVELSSEMVVTNRDTYRTICKDAGQVKGC
ncbi:MAG TPA: prepilin-type cleavage/methylation domain-containing protein [Cyanobacteria bacterium UBA11149]|nr:prepilin-type cleavage/methylation domain-containing protein [Cyanobacteria bacterium UBA11367]HBE60247.1 prepilin-type cleavage/methylation domain-containing protein [Cyanobacteria bacterium UBA11366]HBK66498.1 prepilin-type cleavage/methylation domain-containing protein [Cyanobacteria bacterium UBA11166]HBR76897.1 prepilin-type cleavage/methylation domain-containing protein [Cyanobacteria bacterium UBA11159]HBS70451.1 prepilin-type cleavage/methylation domain-containing protein [Cyanobacte